MNLYTLTLMKKIFYNTSLVLFVFLFIVPSAIAQEWQFVGSREFSPQSSIEPNLVFSPTTNQPYVAYQGNNTANVMSFTAGSWTAVGIEDFTDPSSTYKHKMAFNSAGVPYVAYENASASSIVVQSFVSGAWTIVGGDVASGTLGSSSIAINSSNIPYVSYTDFFSNTVYVKRFVSGSWQNVGLPIADAEEGSIAFNGGIPYLAYIDQSGTDRRVTVQRFSSGSWQIVGNDNFSGRVSGIVKLVLDNSNVPHVVYRDFDASNQISVMRFNGSTWEFVGVAGTNGSTGEHPSLAFHPTTNIPYIVYENISEKTKVKFFDGSNWIDMNDGLPTTDGTDPDIAFHPVTEEPYIVFRDGGTFGNLSVMRFGPVYYSKVAGGNWNTSATWGTNCGTGTGAVPTAMDKVVICSGFDVVVNGTANCGSLVVDGTLQLSSGSLTVNGTTTINSGATIDDNANAGINTFGEIINNGNFTTTAIGNTEYRFNGDITNNSSFSMTGGSPQYRFESPVTITNNNGNMLFSPSANTGTCQVNADVIIANGSSTGNVNLYGGLSIASGRTLTNNYTNGKLSIGTLSGAGILENNGTILYNSSTSPIITGGFNNNAGSIFRYNADGNVRAATYYHVEFRGGGVTTSTLLGDITVNGNLTIGNTRTFDVGNFNIDIKGNWANKGTFIAGTGTGTTTGIVTFSETTPMPVDQTIEGATTFKNLVINNPEGVTLLDADPSPPAILATPITVSNQLTLTDGYVILNDNNLTYEGIEANLSSTATSFVVTNGTNGNFIRTSASLSTAGSKKFPIGVEYSAGSFSDNLVNITYSTAPTSNVSLRAGLPNTNSLLAIPASAGTNKVDVVWRMTQNGIISNLELNWIATNEEAGFSSAASIHQNMTDERPTTINPLQATSSDITSFTGTHDFAVFGTAAPLPTQPVGNRGLYFENNFADPVEYVDLGTGLNSQLYTGDFTMMGWMKRKNLMGENNLLSNRPTGNTGISFGTQGSTLKFTFGDVDGINVLNALPNQNEWYHIAATYDASTDLVSIYVNGEFKDSKTITSPTSNSENLKIGYSEFFNIRMRGQIDEVKIFSTDLDEGRIQVTMGDTDTMETDLIGYWNFDQGTTSVADDVQTNTTVNNGTLTNTPLWALRVTNALDDPNQGSLRWAINEANSDTDKDYVDFSIDNVTPSTHTITLGSPLDLNITTAFIDGYSALGSSDTNLLIDINGNTNNIFNLSTNNSTLQGLILRGGNIAVNVNLGNNNTISQNSIFDNSYGIVLASGANNNKFPPTINTVTTSAVLGFCTGCSNGEVVEIFRNDNDYSTGQEQGQEYLGFAVVDMSSEWSFSFPTAITTTDFITATITDANGNTSPFSDARGVVTETITLGTITLTTYCAGQTITIPFTTTGTFNIGNVFTAQLSDASGNFTTPIPIGTGTTFPISAVIPNPIPAGSGYKIRVISSDPFGIISDEFSGVTVNPIPAAPTITGTTTICSGSTATLTATGGGTFNWYPTLTGGISLANTSTYTTPPLTANTTYYVDRTDGSGCVSSPRTATTVTVNPNPVLSPSSLPNGTLNTAYNQTITASGGISPYTYSFTTTPPIWLSLNSGTGQLSGTPTSAGTYTFSITVTDNNSCTAIQSYTIIINNPTITLGTITSTTYCAGTTISVPFTTSGGGFNAGNTFTAQLSDASGNFTTPITIGTGNSPISLTVPTTAGTGYRIRVISSNPSVISTISGFITINPATTITNPSNQIITAGDNATFNVSATGTGLTYQWQERLSTGTTFNDITGATSPDLTLTTVSADMNGNLYRVVVTGDCGNVTSINATLTVNCPSPIEVDAISPQTICNGASTPLVTLSSNQSGATFSWTAAATDLSSSPVLLGTSSTIPVETLSTSGSTAGSLVYTITPTYFGCTGTPYTYTVTVNPTPNVTASPPNQTICSGATTNIALSGTATTYDWTASATSGTVTISNISGTGNISQPINELLTGNGTVTYQITPTANACTGNSISVVVTVNPTPNVILSIINSSVCPNSDINFEAIVSPVLTGTYMYNFSVNGNSVQNLTSNTFTANSLVTGDIVTVTVTDPNNCTSSNSITMTVADNQAPVLTPLPNVTKNTDPTNCYYTNRTTNSSPRISDGIASDNCGVASYRYILSGATLGDLSSLEGIRFNKGVTNVSWTATDINGNVSSPSQFTITVVDAQNPVIQAPQNITTTTDLYGCSSTRDSLTIGTPIVSDNCLVRYFNDAPAEFPIGETIVIWTAIDSAGNRATAEQIITIEEQYYVLPSDSLILVDIYNQMGGSSWNNRWNLNTPASTWRGIGVRCGKVASINLFGNNLTGTLPSSVLNLERRTEPDFSLNIGGNRLGFESAESFVAAISNFTYSPQAKIYAPRTELINQNELITFNSETAGNFNNYQWFKDQNVITGATNPTYTITSAVPSDAGIYVCQITNTVATQLILERSPITLEVAGFVNATDSLALVRIFEETGGAGWTNLWDLTQPVATWQGVTLVGNKVRELDLSSRNLIGLLPDVFDAELFSELRYLSFFDNKLEGQIPASIGSLITLTYLDLDKNDFEGSVPASFGNLINLQSLWLSRNNLTSLPDEIGNLANLRTLYLNDNNFSSLPETIGNLSELLVLNVSDNELISLPNSVTNLRKLNQFYANRNFITTIPQDVQNLVDLTVFEINSNKLTALPNGLLQLSNLTKFRVAENKLEFDDLLPYANRTYSTFDYAPQAPINEEEDRLVTLNSSVSFAIQTQGNGNVYQWFRDGNSVATTQNFTINRVRNSDAGLYTAQITNPALPDLILQRRPIILNVECQAGLSFAIKQPTQTVFCENQPFGLKLDIDSDFAIARQIRWRKDGIVLAFANEKSYTVTRAGTYTAEVLTQQGCTAISNVVEITLIPQPEVDIELSIDNNDETGAKLFISTLNSQESVAYQWLKNGIPIEGATQSNYKPTQTGEYSVLVKTQTGCSSVSQTIIFTADDITGIEEPIELRNLSIFPNPNKGNFFIDFGTNTPNGEPIFIMIDAIGRKLILRTKQISSTRYEATTTNLTAGMYYLQIQTKDGLVFRKFVIEE